MGGATSLGLALSACGIPTTKPPATTPSVTQASPTVTITPGTDRDQKTRVLRIAHMTDFHVMPNGNAPEGMAKALRHAQSQADPPDLIINTGDSIMDSLGADKSNAEAQWQVFQDILKAENKLPIFHAIGNHDVWGWGRQDAETQNDPLYGKNMALEKLGLQERYYSFDKAGWHFVVLDSNHLPNEVSGGSYIGKLDDEQFSWLENDVAQVDGSTPVCVVSHIPILCACEFFDGPNEETGAWVVPAAWMHIDARRFRGLYLEHPNIRLCLSGHSHQHESLDYLGVKYLTDGAVCGNWWNGAYLDFPPAYVLVDLYDDGSAESLFVPYEQG